MVRPPGSGVSLTARPRHPRGGCARPRPPRSRALPAGCGSRAGARPGGPRSIGSAAPPPPCGGALLRSGSLRARPGPACPSRRGHESEQLLEGQQGIRDLRRPGDQPRRGRRGPDDVRRDLRRRGLEAGGAQIGDHALADDGGNIAAHGEHDGARDRPPPGRGSRFRQRGQQQVRDRRRGGRAAGEEVAHEIVAVDGGGGVPPGLQARKGGMSGVEDEQQRCQELPRADRGRHVGRTVAAVAGPQREAVQERTAPYVAAEGDERGASAHRRGGGGHVRPRARPAHAGDRRAGGGEVRERRHRRCTQPQDDGRPIGGHQPGQLFGGEVAVGRAAFDPRSQPGGGRGRRAQEPPQRTDHVRGPDRGPIVEHRPRAQPQGPFAAVGGHRPGLGEGGPRDQVPEIDQALVDEGRDEARSCPVSRRGVEAHRQLGERHGDPASVHRPQRPRAGSGESQHEDEGRRGATACHARSP